MVCLQFLKKLAINPTLFYHRINENLNNLHKFQLEAREKIFKALFPLSGETNVKHTSYINCITTAYEKEWTHMINAKMFLADANRPNHVRTEKDLGLLLQAVSDDVTQIIKSNKVTNNNKLTFANAVTKNNVTKSTMMQSKSTMMQSKSQPKQSKGRKQMTSRPKTLKKTMPGMRLHGMDVKN